MKRVIILSSLLCCFCLVKAQITVKGVPKVKNLPTIKGKQDKSSQEDAKSTVDTLAKPATIQDDTYTGPAKVYVRAFWTNIEKLKTDNATASTITNAERAINSIKEKDPSYNTSALEAELKPWKDKAAKETGNANTTKAKKEETNNYFKEIWHKVIGIHSTGRDIEPGVTGKKYYDRVKAINITEYEEKKKELGVIDPKSYPGLIEAKLADYDDYVKRADRLKWNIVAMITKSADAPNLQDKLKFLNEAKYECMAVLLLSPNNEPFKKKLEEINKLMGNTQGEAAKFFTSDFHKEHLNKIVWSSKPLIIGKEKEMVAVIKNEFKTSEAIFGTVYLGMNVKDLMDGNVKLRVRIRIDGGTAVWGGDLSYFDLPLSAQGKSYIQFALLPDAQWFKENYAPYISQENWTYSYFIDNLVKAGDVSHEISCDLLFPALKLGEVESKLNLDLNAGITDLKTLSTKLHNELMASRQLPKAGMNNPGIESQMVSAANKLGWNDKFTKAIITSSNWTVRKNELTGAIINRTLGAVCVTKDPDGKCFYQEFSFSQDYTGSGNYSGTVKYYSYGGKREIGCDKIK